jgi:hypothetical protein
MTHILTPNSHDILDFHEVAAREIQEALNAAFTLTPTQNVILTHAVEHTEGRLEWFPPQIRGGAQSKVLKALHDRHLITFDDPIWHVDDFGYDALGLPRPGSRKVLKPAPEPATTVVDPVEPPNEMVEQPVLVDPIEAEPPAEPASKTRPTPRTRDKSKQATVIRLLSRPEGATLAQITEATQWQLHTTRGFLAGAVKKRLGLQLTSEKPEGGVRIYRVVD